MKKIITLKSFGMLSAASAVFLAMTFAPAHAGPREDILAGFAAEAPGGFDAQRGATLFTTNFGTGKPDTPACTTCHGANPQASGETRTGKPIDPMAVSKTPDRYTDPAKVEKWFRRNCTSVLGRECTAQEKGDFLTFMIGQ